MTPNAILEQLDRAAKGFVFPMLDNGYVYPADVRLSIYRDTKFSWIVRTCSDIGPSGTNLLNLTTL